MADEPADMDELLASLRADAADLRTFLQVLAIKLDGALPGRVRIQRHGGLFSHDKSVESIAVDLGENHYAIAAGKNGAVEARRERSVRGIVLKTEQLPIDGWIGALVAELQERAETSSVERIALERLLLDRRS